MLDSHNRPLVFCVWVCSPLFLLIFLLLFDQQDAYCPYLRAVYLAVLHVMWFRKNKYASAFSNTIQADNKEQTSSLITMQSHDMLVITRQTASEQDRAGSYGKIPYFAAVNVSCLFLVSLIMHSLSPEDLLESIRVNMILAVCYD